jgi:hypothetical protein
MSLIRTADGIVAQGWMPTLNGECVSNFGFLATEEEALRIGQEYIDRLLPFANLEDRQQLCSVTISAQRQDAFASFQEMERYVNKEDLMHIPKAP